MSPRLSRSLSLSLSFSLSLSPFLPLSLSLFRSRLTPLTFRQQWVTELDLALRSSPRVQPDGTLDCTANIGVRDVSCKCEQHELEEESLSSRPLGALLIRPIRGRDSMWEGNEWSRREHSMRPSTNYRTLGYPVIVVSLSVPTATFSDFSRRNLTRPLGINYNWQLPQEWR